MSPLSRPLAAVIAAALLAFAPSSAGAASDPRAQRDAARDKKAKLAAQLDALNASEKDLLAAQKTLDDQVRAQSALTSGAEQSAATAAAEVADVTAQVEKSRRRVDTLDRAVVNRAVQEYMNPTRGSPADFGDSADLADRARRQALLNAVAGSTEDTLDQLRTSRQDLELEQSKAAAGQQRAAASAAEAARRFKTLQDAETAQSRIRAGVDTRRRQVLAQIDAESRAEAELNRIVAERERQRPPVVNVPGGSGSAGCIWPVNGTVTSEYGERWGRLHAGIDIAGPIGTPIRAAKPGEVVFASAQSGYGLIVIIQHAGGMDTRYAHMSSISVSDGQQVQQGQTIGARGNTGESTGPHLHFETRYGGSPRNPRSCLS